MTIKFSATYESGQTLAVTLERISDGYLWRETATQAWETVGTSTFDQRKISLTEGNSDKLGSYTGVSSGLFGNPGRVRARLHNDGHANNYTISGDEIFVWNSEELIPLRSQVTDNMVYVDSSGLIWSNLVQISGSPVSKQELIGPDSYYAAIKFIHDLGQDEYAVTWYKNALIVSSGDISNPAISVKKTSDGTYLVDNQTMNFIGAEGDLRYNDNSNIAISGEPYMVYVSGTIDSAVRVWKNPIGIDYV